MRAVQSLTLLAMSFALAAPALASAQEQEAVRTAEIARELAMALAAERAAAWQADPRECRCEPPRASRADKTASAAAYQRLRARG